MKFNKICIIGAPNVGKSTLIEKLRDRYNVYSIHPQFNNIKEKYFPNKEFTQLSNEELIEFSIKSIQARIELEKKQEILFSEGGILYDFAWIIYFTQNILKKEFDFSKINKLISKNINNYNLTIYIPREFKCVYKDKPFETKESQTKINEIILDLLKQYKVKYLILTGTVQQRLESTVKLIE